MNNDNFNKFINELYNYSGSGNHISLYYSLNNNLLRVCNEKIQLDVYDSFNLTNLNKLLSIMKKDYDLNFLIDEIQIT